MREMIFFIIFLIFKKYKSNKKIHLSPSGRVFPDGESDVMGRSSGHTGSRLSYNASKVTSFPSKMMMSFDVSLFVEGTLRAPAPTRVPLPSFGVTSF